MDLKMSSLGYNASVLQGQLLLFSNLRAVDWLRSLLFEPCQEFLLRSW